MCHRRPPLTPYPLPLLLGRVATEWESRQRIFDLPVTRFFQALPECDLAVQVAGRRVGTPAGPAAGPHTQLAQNIVLGWLAGARIFELKTVQVLDELEIDRPCIDMATVGYNVEWSQELTLTQSLTEYVKAWVMVEILRGWEPLRSHLGEPGDHVFELSVGYNLAGIRSEPMAQLIEGLRDASAAIDALRSQIPPPFTDQANLPFSSQIIHSATLSAFHGCPPDEIEAIVRHLMQNHELDVTVKLNPTLLGYRRVADILHERLGYEEIELLPEAFAEDLDLDRAVVMITALADFAREQCRTFGIKLTNTLVVGNHKTVLPGERMYLSGPPLHVLAVALLEELASRLPGLLQLGPRTDGVPVAFSAGIDRNNFAQAVGLGLVPVTICSDLLKPGGYGRLAPMLRRLTATMREAGCADVSTWVVLQETQAVAAGHRDSVAAYAATLLDTASARRYSHAATAKPPRQTPDRLQLWDCCSCNLCVTVCPNDAMLRLETPATQQGQYVCLAELCNACGNCTTFCPEQGDPFAVKPRLFFQYSRYAQEDGQAFLVREARSGENGVFAVESVPALVPEAQRLTLMLDGSGGLPFRPSDLTGDLER